MDTDTLVTLTESLYAGLLSLHSLRVFDVDPNRGCLALSGRSVQYPKSSKGMAPDRSISSPPRLVTLPLYKQTLKRMVKCRAPSASRKGELLPAPKYDDRLITGE